jgi:hypothetical protein
MTRIATATVLLVSLLSGCVALDDAGDGGPAGTGTGLATGPSASASAGPSSTPAPNPSTSSSSTGPQACGGIPGHCDQGSYVTVTVRVPQGGTVDVPLPHADRCLPPSGWSVQGASNATATLRTVERGEVYTVMAAAGGVVTLAIDKSPYPSCQTFRADPWSVDPDPEDGSLPVNATVATALRVEVHDVSRYCYTDADFEGTAGPGWTTLAKVDGSWVCQ